MRRCGWRHTSLRLGRLGVLGLFALTLGTQNARTEEQPSIDPHKAIQIANPPTLRTANSQPNFTSQAAIRVEGGNRIIHANGIPSSLTGSFPNEQAPYPIRPQAHQFVTTAYPSLSDEIAPIGNHIFGVAVDGIPIKSNAEEWYLNRRGSDWQYEPLSGAFDFGLDTNTGHVGPNGDYHYHGLSRPLLRKLGARASAHSPLVGWAADGFPIYALYGYANPTSFRSGIRYQRPSYRLKTGDRPTGLGKPGGKYDGTFTSDYEYVAELGDLDECNGKVAITPEFPSGIYAYFLTDDWPIVPRCFKGKPSKSFLQQLTTSAITARPPLNLAQRKSASAAPEKAQNGIDAKLSSIKNWFRIPSIADIVN